MNIDLVVMDCGKSRNLDIKSQGKGLVICTHRHEKRSNFPHDPFFDGLYPWLVPGSQFIELSYLIKGKMLLENEGRAPETLSLCLNLIKRHELV
jgi:hypothetical protein